MNIEAIERKYMRMWENACDEQQALDRITDKIIDVRTHNIPKETAIEELRDLINDYPSQKEIIAQVIDELEEVDIG